MNAPFKAKLRGVPTGAAKAHQDRGLALPSGIVCATSDEAVRSELREAAVEAGVAEVSVLPLEKFVAVPAPAATAVFVVDLALPGMGAEWHGHLARLAQAAPLVLIFDAADAAAGARIALRLNARDVLVKPIDPVTLRGTLAAALAANGRVPADVTGVVSAVGGAGGTSVAITIADHLANGERAGHRTCLIDLDMLTGAAGLHLDASCAHDVSKDLGNPERIDASYLDVVVKPVEKLSVLSIVAPSEPARDALHAFALRALDVMETTHDCLVLDVPHWANEKTLALLAAANRVFVVTTPTVPALKLAKDKVEALSRLGCDPAAVTILINRQKQSLLGNGNRLDPKAITKMLGAIPFEFVREDEETMLDAVNCGLPPRAVSRRSAMVKDVVKAFEGAAKTVELVAPAPRRSFLGKRK